MFIAGKIYIEVVSIFLYPSIHGIRRNVSSETNIPFLANIFKMIRKPLKDRDEGSIISLAVRANWAQHPSNI